MSDRLTELQRQRALIQDHLTWLDQEIAAASGQAVAPSTSALRAAQPAVPAVVAAAPEEPLADELLAKFTADKKSSVQGVKKGCVQLFALGMVLLVLGIYGLYRYSRSLHENDPPKKVKPTHDAPINR